MHRIEQLRIAQIFWIFCHHWHVARFSTVLDGSEQGSILLIAKAGNVLLINATAKRAHKLLKQTRILVIKLDGVRTQNTLLGGIHLVPKNSE